MYHRQRHIDVLPTDDNAAARLETVTLITGMTRIAEVSGTPTKC